MARRPLAALAGALLVAVSLATTPVIATPRDTTVRTIQDTNDDNLLEYTTGEDYLVVGESEDFRPPRDGSILNFLQMTDFQLVDEESPARVEFLDGTQRPQGLRPFSAAYRPMESLTTQVEEAMSRAARNTTSPITGEQLDLTILTGDNADNQQFNETRWFIDILDGTAGRRDAGALPQEDELPEGFEIPDEFVLADKIDPNSGIPVPGCEATPGSIYDGVRGGGVEGVQDNGYYEPDGSGGLSDGDGYSPYRAKNQIETGLGPAADVTVRDFPGLFEAANQPFEAVGIDMPWYTAFGNHDALLQGNSTDAYFGPGSHYGTPVAPDTEVWNPQFQMVATGCLKPSNAQQHAALVAALQDGNISEEERDELTSIPIVPPDARRCALAKDEPGIGTPLPCSTGGWIEQHFLTTGAPVGHGFAPAPCASIAFLPTPQDALCAAYGRPPIADFYNDGYYSFSPRPGLRFVVLDTVTDDCGTLFCSEGSVDDAQFRWLQAQIEAAATVAEYVVVFSHHTLRTTRWPSTDLSEHPMHYGQLVDPSNPFNPQNPTGGETLEELYCNSPNVIGHVAGHEHENYVQHYDCAPGPKDGLAVGPSAAFGGFWQVSTAAHIDWPQQSRMIELVDNGDSKTMSLVLTILDHAGEPLPGLGRKTSADVGQSGEQVLKLASIARELAYNDYQGDRTARGDPHQTSCPENSGNNCPTARSEDRNVIIVLDRPWPYSEDTGTDRT